jgi:hypothetical protein
LRLNDFARETIDLIDSSGKGFIPVLKRHRCICKKRQANLNSMAMLSLSRAVLFMRMRIRN